MLLLRGKISSAKALAYMVAQVAGAVLGAFLCTLLIPGVQAGAGLGAPGEQDRWQGSRSYGVFAALQAHCTHVTRVVSCERTERCAAVVLTKQ
jgi:glycerol uptake facilitator-like aquaporin